jgi:hypothetical protein
MIPSMSEYRDISSLTLPQLPAQVLCDFLLLVPISLIPSTISLLEKMNRGESLNVSACPNGTAFSRIPFRNFPQSIAKSRPRQRQRLLLDFLIF